MKSVFDRLVTKEDQFTQLLFNLMQRTPEFRSGILGFLLSHPDGVNVDADQVHTQRHVGELADCGRPDINISSHQLRAFIEVKVDPGCGLTQNQQLESGSASELKNYVTALASSPNNGCHKCLVYLVPRDWVFLPQLMASIQSQSGMLRTKAVSVYTKHWEDILAWLNDSVIQMQNPLVNELRLLLEDHFGPVELSKEDLKMLFSQEYVETWAAMQKLQTMIDEIERRANRSGYVVSSTHRKDEYGLYFSKERGREPVWFGTWYQFLEKHGSPLCFGIQTSKASAAMKTALDAACDGNTTVFMGYLVGTIAAGAVESAETVWSQLAPVLEKVLGGPQRSH